MNKEQTLEAIKVMQAWVDGKTIQVAHKGSTAPPQTTNLPIWDWGCYIYSIKPEPREWYVNTETGMATEAKPGCCVYYKSSIGELVKVREVLE